MRVCQIFHRDYPWDVRVEKIQRSLTKRGHEVHLICNNAGRMPREETLDGVRIHRLPNLPWKKVDALVRIPVFFNPHWIRHVAKVTRKHRCDVLVVRDLPLVLVGWFVGKRFDIPVVYDMAENFPAMLRNFKSVLKSPGMATVVERLALRAADHITVVVEESRERVIGKGVKAERVSVVGNTPVVDVLEDMLASHRGRTSLDEGKFNLLYIGYVTHLRGLDLAVKGIGGLVKDVENIKFTVVGDGADLPYLKDLVRSLKLEKYVEFMGWVDFKYLPSMIAECHVGVIPHYSNEHTNSTIPNKLFDFMALGKPVIVSDVRPMRRIVSETGCGVVYKSDSEDDFREKVLILRDSGLRSSMGMNGMKAVKEQYNWAKDEERLFSAVEKSVRTDVEAE